MRTTLLKKMSAVVMATLMVVAMFAGMAFSTSAAAADVYAITVGGNATVATSDATIVSKDTTTVTIKLNNEVTTNTALWAAKGDYVQVKLPNGDYINMTAGTTKEAIVDGVKHAFVTKPMADWMSAKAALNKDLETKTKDYTTFYGYDFVLTDGTTTAKYSKGEATWDGTTLKFTKFVPAANVTLTVTGPNVTDGVSTGRKADSYDKDGFLASVVYEKSSETLRVQTIEKAAKPADTTTKDVSLSNATTVTFGKDNWLTKNGMALNYVTFDDGVLFVSINMKNVFIDETPVEFTVEDAAIVDGKATFKATDYNQTFTVALTDGTYGLIRFAAATNYDTEEAFTADMLVDLVKSSAFRSLKGLTSVQGENGIFVDMINAVVGQSNKYIKWTQAKDADGKDIKNTFENKGFADKDSKTKYTQADVNKKIALFGYFTEADGSITSKVQNYWGSMTFYEPNNIPGFNDKFTGVKDLYTGSATVLVYNDGTEDVQAILYHNDAATVLPVVMNDVTYNVPVFHIIRSDYTKAFAVGTAATQQVATTVTNAGSYSYSLTGSEMGLSKLVKEETPIALTLTSKVQLSHELNANTAAADSSVILVLRAPKGTSFDFDEGKTTTTIEEVKLPTATVLTTTDGLVDYFFKLSYNTFADTTVTIEMTYANGVWKKIDVKTTWLTTDKAIEGFTATIPASTADLVIALPERPIESQETPSIEIPVSSSTATPVESTPASSSTGSDLEVPGTGNPFSAVAYLITLCASAIGGISTLVIRKKK